MNTFIRKFQANNVNMVFYSPLKSRCSCPQIAYLTKGCALSWAPALYMFTMEKQC